MSTHRPVGTRQQRWLEIGFIALLFLAALLLRTWQLDRFPPGLYNDEAAYGMDGRSLLAGDLRVFYERNNGREPLFIYLLALAFQSLGATAYALRLTAAVVGALHRGDDLLDGA
jgi:predicted membrane-bound mannosyltransferase